MSLMLISFHLEYVVPGLATLALVLPRFGLVYRSGRRT